MKIVEQKAELVNISNPVEKIEYIGRVCYGSQSSIAPGTADKFVSGLVNSKHYSPLEHAAIAFVMDYDTYRFMCDSILDAQNFAGEKLYLNTIVPDGSRYIISGNFRSWLEFLEICVNEYISVSEAIYKELKKYDSVFGLITHDLLIPSSKCSVLSPEGMNDVESYNHAYYTVHALTNRAIQQEFTRHRPFSFTIESTRYIAYDKEKFGAEIRVIKPWEIDEAGLTSTWVKSMEIVEETYKSFRDFGVSPQNARDILPLCLASDMYITGNRATWEHFFELRLLGVTGAPHPQIKDLANKIYGVMYDDIR